MSGSIGSAVGVAMGAMVSLALSAGSGPVAAQTPELTAEERAELAARVQAAAVPGPEHELLERLAGEWRAAYRLWSGPGSDPATGSGTTVNELAIGGRFLVSEGRASLGGRPLESLTILGFDRRHGEYTVVVYDSFGTYYVTAEGQYDAARSALVLAGREPDPLLGHTQVYEFVIRMPDPDRYVLEIWFEDEAHTGGGPPFKAYEATHTRLETDG